MKLLQKIGIGFLIGLVVACMFFAPGVNATSSVNVSGDSAYGTITSAGTAVTVSLGWVPKEVIITRATGTTCTAIWNKQMPNGSCFKLISQATGTTAQTTKQAMQNVGCVSTYAGSSTAAPGFTLGTDSDINTSGSDTLYWRAHR